MLVTTIEMLIRNDVCVSFERSAGICRGNAGKTVSNQHRKAFYFAFNIFPKEIILINKYSFVYIQPDGLDFAATAKYP